MKPTKHESTTKTQSSKGDVMRGVTMKQMCEHIVKAEILERPDGTKPTAKEIFNYSPTGELYMVFEWYKMACEVLKHHA